MIGAVEVADDGTVSGSGLMRAMYETIVADRELSVEDRRAIAADVRSKAEAFAARLAKCGAVEANVSVDGDVELFG